ncbi:cobalamin biosynthesis protein CbiD [Thermanaerovibrio velox DSM 12556]|uniref:Cobalt-precorrin-5B C(1)-methyltransferase n=1 Tax=Thermanaerovibrio velox DSM 12556 TaxID=926567 RepID=H0UMW5_9BACT|nr:cobalt-precorrin-5B (C(1))-methyltransferase CbiD [Thermanaerovibrio velox]EHM09260.1 cobalamin biosynthesis protein CbiD [Thermanaerovibrio velox DSM 12556]
MSLRCGFTTGSAATAAAMGAALWLLGRPSSWVKVKLPSGSTLSIPLGGCERIPGGAQGWVFKDAGDDPDVTHLSAVAAKVRLHRGDRVTVDGGPGVGTVTRPGLPVPVGAKAINPGPLRMIRENLLEILPRGIGAQVEVWVPRGEELAKGTFNPKLGIEGGISILGTTGVVRPMSEDAVVETIRSELSVIRAEGFDLVCLAPGNYGRDFAASLGVPGSLTVNVSNYVGKSLEACAKLKFRGLIFIAQVGKMAKVAAGSMDTHSSKSDGRLEALCAYGALHGMNSSWIRRIMECNTADQAANLMAATIQGRMALEELCRRARDRAKALSGAEAAVLTFSLPRQELARSGPLEEMIEAMRGL